MASTLSAFSEAFSAYLKNLGNCLAYSILFGLACAAVLSVLAAIAFVFGILSVGSLVGIFAGNGTLSLSLVVMGGVLLVLLLGALIVFWLLSGLYGSYYETRYAMLSGKKLSLARFFSAIPARATPIFLAQAACGLIVAVPSALLVAAGWAADGGSGTVSLLALVAAKLYGAIIGFLSIFITASIVADGRGAADSVRHSFSLVARHTAPSLLFVLFSLAVSIPALLALAVPVALSVLNVAGGIVGVLAALSFLFIAAYCLFFSFPIIVLANLALYRKLR